MLGPESVTGYGVKGSMFTGRECVVVTFMRLIWGEECVLIGILKRHSRSVLPINAEIGLLRKKSNMVFIPPGFVRLSRCGI